MRSCLRRKTILIPVIFLGIVSFYPHHLFALSKKCKESIVLVGAGALSIGVFFAAAEKWVNADANSYQRLQQTVIKPGKIDAIRDVEVRNMANEVLQKLHLVQRLKESSTQTEKLGTHYNSLIDLEWKLVEILKAKKSTLNVDELWAIREVGYHLYQIHGGEQLGMPFADPRDSRASFQIIDISSK